GRRYEYKTDVLNNPEAAAQLCDVANCVIHFYDEFNIRHNPAGYPSVLLQATAQQEIFPIPVDDDPLAYVTQF
ncbi:hypothetical protein, partial [uncultured Hymenobacter sp.]|uniref:hypothetical protein n=1 Tax=uncultured Hymenobacter sp. TaxID=170016 RepID=UPI0035C9F083